MTKQRQLIHSIIMDKQLHLTAEEIYEQAQLKMPGIARGTVYRNLGLMVAAGEIGKLELDGEASYYDRTVTPHAHLVCRCCGALEDLMSDALTETLSSLVGEDITSYSLVMYHICRDCRGQE